MATLKNTRSILVIKDKTDHLLYVNQFAEYIKNGFLVANEESFLQFDIVENTCFSKLFTIENKSFKLTDDTSEFSLYSELPTHISISAYNVRYTKGFIQHYDYRNDVIFDLNGEDTTLPLPVAYVYDEALECLDSEKNEFTFDDDTKFSYSCGYYDGEKMTVIDFDLVDRDYTVTLENGKIVHEDDAVWCEEIQEYHLMNECTQLESGEWLPDYKVIRTADGCYYSRNDYDITTCEGCNGYFHLDDLNYNEHDECQYCENCYEEHSRGLKNRLCYSTNVINYHGFGDHQSKINGKLVYIGFELECLADESEAEELDENLRDMQHGHCNFNYCVPTVDGSLDDNYGVEFIFKPDSLENHSENLEHFIDNVGEQLYKTAGNGYGLHVHVSNNFLSDFDKIKIQNFASIHDSKLRFIGGRDETGYQPKKMLGKTSDMKKGNANKYQAVNISPYNTIEFRFPVSLVDHSHIMRNLQLAYSLCLYVKYHCNYANINDFNLYLNWLKTDKQFKLLSDYFAQL